MTVVYCNEHNTLRCLSAQKGALLPAPTFIHTVPGLVSLCWCQQLHVLFSIPDMVAWSGKTILSVISEFGFKSLIHPLPGHVILVRSLYIFKLSFFIYNKNNDILFYYLPSEAYSEIWEKYLPHSKHSIICGNYYYYTAVLTILNPKGMS